MGRNSMARRLEAAQERGKRSALQQEELIRQLVLAVQQLQLTVYGPPDHSAPGLIDIVRKLYEGREVGTPDRAEQADSGDSEGERDRRGRHAGSREDQSHSRDELTEGAVPSPDGRPGRTAEGSGGAQLTLPLGGAESHPRGRTPAEQEAFLRRLRAEAFGDQ